MKSPLLVACVLVVCIAAAQFLPSALADDVAKNTQAGTVPWHVGIYVDKGDDKELICGGALIAPNLVVSAAQCFCLHPCSGVNAINYNVALGKDASAWLADSSAPSVQQMSVHSVILYPRYRGWSRNFEYDVALLELTTAAVLTSTVQPAQLDWSRSLQPAPAEGVVAGWGLSATGPSNALQSITLTYVDLDQCYEAAPQTTQYLISRGRFCAGSTRSRHSACPGDLGEAFTVKDAHNKAIVLGVLSLNLQPLGFNRSICYTGSFTVFTDLTDQLYLDWIRGLYPEVPPAPPTPTSPPPPPPCPTTTCPTTTCPTTACPTPPPPPMCPTTTCPTTPRPPPAPRPTYLTMPLLPGYSRIPGVGCYKYHAAAASWTDAKQACEREGGHLVILNSQAEATAMVSLNKQNHGSDSTTTYIWVGMRESSTAHNDYYTIFGERLSATGFSRWAPDRWSIYNTTLGDVVLLRSYDGVFEDIPITHIHKFPYVCEQRGC